MGRQPLGDGLENLRGRLFTEGKVAVAVVLNKSLFLGADHGLLVFNVNGIEHSQRALGINKGIVCGVKRQ